MADPMKLAMTVSLIDKLTAPAKKLQRSVAGVTEKFGDAAREAKGTIEPLRGMSRRLDDIAQAARRGDYRRERRGRISQSGVTIAVE